MNTAEERGRTTAYKKPFWSHQRKQAMYGALYILPACVIITAFCIVTIFMAVYYSFTEYNMINEPQFVGLKNYAKLFTDKTFWAAMVNTVKYVVITVPAQVCISLGLAAFLAEKLQNRFGNFVKSVMFIPYIISGIAASAVWSILFKRDGLINVVLGTVMEKNPNWLGDRKLAFICVCIVVVWKWIFPDHLLCGSNGRIQRTARSGSLRWSHGTSEILVYHSTGSEADHLHGGDLKHHQCVPGI